MLIIIFILSVLAASPAWADVSSSGSSESHTGTTGSASEASFSWSHTPGANPQGAFVCTYGLSSSTNDATSVTYGGTSMTAVSGGAAVESGAEPGNTKVWFLGSSVPTGTVTITVNRNNNANVMYATAGTVTANSDTAVHTAGIVLSQGSSAAAEQSVDDGSPGSNSLRYVCAFSGIDDVTQLPAGANTTAQQTIDIGLVIAEQGRETTGGQGSRSVGFVQAVSDERAFVHFAIKETSVVSILQSTSGVILPIVGGR